MPLDERSWATPGTSASTSASARPRVRSSAAPATTAVARMSTGGGASPSMTIVSWSSTRSASSSDARAASVTRWLPGW